MTQAEIERLQSAHPWPVTPPATHVDWGPAWFSDDEHCGHPRIFKMLIEPQVRTIVELGSFLGRSVAGWLKAFPQAHVIAIDTWQGSSEHLADAQLQSMLPQLMQTFQVNLWDQRQRVTPIRATTLEGLRRLYELRIAPDVIYVDADHATESVIADVTACLDLFPHAQLIGDDWMWPSVRAGVEQVAAERQIPIAACGGVWWFPTTRPSRSDDHDSPTRVDPAREKVITMTAYRRPEYTRQVLEALSRCDGIDDYRVLIHLEPDSPEVLQVAREARLARKTIVENVDRLGCGTNTHCALHHGFQWADFVVHLEDDTVPARDCLRFFEWARQRYRDDRSVLSVTGYSKTIAEREQSHQVVRRPWFTPWGWGTWSDRWREISEHWSNAPLTWDVALNQIRGDRIEVHPILARVQNIGAELGEHCPSSEFHRVNHFNEHGAWSVELPLSATFEEVGSSAVT